MISWSRKTLTAAILIAQTCMCVFGWNVVSGLHDSFGQVFFGFFLFAACDAGTASDCDRKEECFEESKERELGHTRHRFVGGAADYDFPLWGESLGRFSAYDDDSGNTVDHCVVGGGHPQQEVPF